MKVVVVGLGRLGAPMAAVLGAAGVDVVGVDGKHETVRAINSSVAPVVEPGLPEMIRQAGTRLSATADYAQALDGADMSFVVVPTPSGQDGMFLLTNVLAVVRSIGEALRKGPHRRHVVVITSTVMPGSTLGAIRDALEEASGLTVGSDVGLCYSPEFIALGTVVSDLLRPDMILIGESDPASGDVLLATLRAVTGQDVPVARMDPTSAEVAKLAVNTFVTTKISYANMLAEICEGLPGANAFLVTTAVGMDSRIGPKYLTPGAPYGGPCFPRDNVALAALARELGGHADIAEATDIINRRQLDRTMSIVRRYCTIGRRVTVLGLSYKPGTPVRDDSFGVGLVRLCLDEGFDVIGWDPMSHTGPPPELSPAVLTDSLLEALRASDVAIVATPWPELSGVPAILREVGRSIIVIDSWRFFEHADLPSSAVVISGGQGALRQNQTPVKVAQ